MKRGRVSNVTLLSELDALDNRFNPKELVKLLVRLGL